ncbi:hypothetical protein [Candidatus Tisiphia endosymbiont of Oplodontha viridula]|uniref:hypothetical protein n=1 Tax=Candidatus Tisiphia endosymbiont of Oplodontha viridula TaxID=3077925 RepID=UPI0035C937E2
MYNNDRQEHKIYPYLLEGMEVVRINQVCTTDITYIKLPDRFMYFIAIIDLYSRYIVAYTNERIYTGFLLLATQTPISSSFMSLPN